MRDRKAFTLLELLLALALVVVATSLIGTLMSLYARSFATRGEDVRRKQLARSILAMIADDVRAVVVKHEYDAKVFRELFGDSSMDLDAALGTDGSGTGTGSSTSLSAESPSADSTSLDSAADLSSGSFSSLPPGLYGNQYQLMVDVSRVPRVDEYQAQQVAIGTLADVPGEIKRACYFVQAPNPIGVQDSILGISANLDGATSPYTSGLIRRQIDRSVAMRADETGSGLQLMGIGDVIAPEVLSIEFAYFNGTQWTYQWDSTTLGLPQLIQITLAMQSATGQSQSKVSPGISLATLDQQQRLASGIEVYELTVAIPGSLLQAAATLTNAASSGSGETSNPSGSSGGTNP